MIPKITQLKTKREGFPEEKSPGDIVINRYNEMFVYDSTRWHLVGGRFIDPLKLFEVLSYLKSGWPSSGVVLQDDVESILLDKLVEPMPSPLKRYEFNSPLWYEKFVSNLLQAHSSLTKNL